MLPISRKELHGHTIKKGSTMMHNGKLHGVVGKYKTNNMARKKLVQSEATCIVQRGNTYYVLRKW
jgi:hypothetical protein